jgi:hypothetical protein
MKKTYFKLRSVTLRGVPRRRSRNSPNILPVAASVQADEDAQPWTNFAFQLDAEGLENFIFGWNA